MIILMLLQPLLGEDVPHLMRVQLTGVYYSIAAMIREELNLAWMQCPLGWTLLQE